MLFKKERNPRCQENVFRASFFYEVFVEGRREAELFALDAACFREKNLSFLPGNRENSFVIFGKLCFNPDLMTTNKQTQQATGTKNVPAKTRLRVQPLAQDTFSSMSYACVLALLFCEFLALFWLDIF